MDVQAAVALKADAPLTIETVSLDGPREGEVLVEIKATGICHTDAFTLSGADPEGLFPTILGHEGAGIVREVGAGVRSVRPGDHVIPLYTPECRECEYCLHPKTNLCQAIRETQGRGVMPDGTSRFKLGGEPLYGKRHIWWNFVSSRPERIEEAKADWKEGRFPQVPGDDEFIPLPGD